METLLEVRGLSVEFPGVKALDSVDFSLQRGEVVALLGENGAGKSTLIKALTGVYKRAAGEVYLDGVAICPIDTADAQKMGIGTVYQEVNLLPNISIAANLFIGREPLRWGLIDHRTMNQQATKLLKGYGLELDVQRPLADFSIAIQQIVAIARAVDLSAKVLILDEPTASLDAKEVSMLLDILRQLRDQGIGMVFVTHFLDQVYRISDRITVLRNGKLVGTKNTTELPRIELVQMMLGHSFDEQLLKRGEHNIAVSNPLVEFKNYSRRGVVENFDLSVSPGEIVGLAGLLGSGRTETAQLIFGVTTPDTGEAKIQGKPVKIRTPRKASKYGFGYCPEDRKTDGIVGAATVRENIILALQAQRGWLRPISIREQTQIAEDFIQQLGIRTPGPEQQIQYLSGGNQQKVLLARWLATKPRFLILDEPTRGIDVGAHAEIIRLIEKLCDEGLALLIISSELEELAGYADRVIVLRDRRHIAQLGHDEISVPAIMQAIAVQ
ncbi:TPA: galactofuranose ABC transporter, ATP-binding protein YtfR [Yersinia enterocolitica]|uniref:Galactofuranose ABC transporter, ATP-binding protein YtfR n=2 Tax=Yersinia TaxID=629 RepID=A0ABW9F2D7_9GAMM|nr:galactofuranose ABC transporter, ATP-binding protein YtfR [Yersinia proxima]EKN3726820.1 sugar ABC transporter ATP-binding protein [Yersinia enterocolitica]CNL18839.1 putative sugar transport system ATP-binding protein [Yersinia intermedia]EKN4811397.1 sugar ABC transporter ATP-binding protein [Yersinia enterocolitica]ELI8099271.1 sugar ABC transporter ATP-binding protein [Yersinia enterocolitica]HDL7330065.1 sugar ABC transporter ATP-binding protein [Yersinia enterocolitica]